MSSNFQFLEPKWPGLSQLGQLAEKNIFNDSNTTLIKLGIFAERLVDYMFAYDNIEMPYDTTQVNKIRVLKQNDCIPYSIDQILYTVRKSRNEAAHDAYEDVELAKTNTSLTFKLAVWFMQTYGDWDFKAPKYIEPVRVQEKDIIDQIKIESEEIAKQYEEDLAKLKNELEKFREAATAEETNDRKQKSAKAASHIKLNEAETRVIIDQQLRDSGWEVDSVVLNYKKNKTLPLKKKSVAIAEWETNAVGSRAKGWADYALFVDQQLVGIVEAKRGSKDVQADIEQSKGYAKAIREEHGEYVIDKWDEYKVPFLFATNGRKYLKQLQEKSGVWFLDARKPTNHPKALMSWHSPEGLMNMIKHDIEKAKENLQNEPFAYLQDPKGLGLRDYQIKAIKNVEVALDKGQENILLSMATGTGKTRTTIGLIYRLIKSDRFRRVLFLVDRSSLGEQAEDSFNDSFIEGLDTFTNIYDVKVLGDKTPELTTKLHISTVQGMVRRILYSDTDIPPIDTYDCIVVDEAHRGYILDKEMGEVEQDFRSQDDYISKYRAVIEYFDAVKIALTATPALHTSSIFGLPVFQYTYREAVIDGFLVDHEPPHKIITDLSADGIKYSSGDVVPIYDPVTHEITNSAELPDDMKIEVEQFNKKVVNENFNKVVLDEITDYIIPTGPEKTLIFAATDLHADMIVRMMKDQYEEKGYSLNDNAIMKITGSIHDPLEAIKRFKNEVNPVIAVTVDLLTTGIDVPAICNLVFLRRVRSRILYEQMIGRGTRLCDDIKKTHFNIYDAVKLYEGLQDVSTMKPVVTKTNVSLETLLDELDQLEITDHKKVHIDMVIAKMQRKKRRLDDDTIELFKGKTNGLSPNQFIEKIRNADLEGATKLLNNYKEAVVLLDKVIYNPTQIIYSTHADQLREHSVGYGDTTKPEDYLQEFGQFIKDNMNKIPALEIVCQRPQELTRESLRQLQLELKEHGYTEINLNHAYNSMTNEAMVADIISFIRQQALGDALLSHEERISNAMRKVRKLQQWKPIQMQWLDRIESQLMKENIIDRESFEKGAFKSNGGYDRINKFLGNQLDTIIDVLNKNLYTEVETA
ncbi:MAG: type I restriction-modification system endonuclease [Firmicutes bacterium HGW-Firmicutes-3]|jgi:type I restriction enzyme R subunit|nr:MAG: type I restriction-modification system endonuclease [Firmicutes bacterium HGW-Firmicutes-3]